MKEFINILWETPLWFWAVIWLGYFLVKKIAQVSYYYEAKGEGIKVTGIVDKGRWVSWDKVERGLIKKHGRLLKITKKKKL